MINVLSTNITSPLGLTTEANYQAVLSGCAALQRYDDLWGLPAPFAASLFSDEQLVVLTAFGAIMIATNLINTVLRVDLDTYLFGYDK